MNTSAMLYPAQMEAVRSLENGNILCGGVGTGKSITALGYFCVAGCDAALWDDGRVGPILTAMPLYIITTARKRDTGEWDRECKRFDLEDINITVDSWNNLHKYEDVCQAFFIFDEQRVVGSGSWTKSFIRITKKNKWILLSATPGDTWMDYIPVFIANGFYKNRTQFLRRHAVYDTFSKYPKVKRWLEVGYLENLRRRITVNITIEKKTHQNHINVSCRYDDKTYSAIVRDRWNPFDNEPILDISQVCSLLRRVVNSDDSRAELVVKLVRRNRKAIVFYNFDYELNILRLALWRESIVYSEWNGHKHEPLPIGEEWAYLVQYAAGCEGWNCVETDTVIFYSQSYSYKQMTQAAGRIDRLNTPFVELYYYTLRSNAPMDLAISKALKNKRTFNESLFARQMGFS